MRKLSAQATGETPPDTASAVAEARPVSEDNPWRRFFGVSFTGLHPNHPESTATWIMALLQLVKKLTVQALFQRLETKVRPLI